MPMPPFAFPAIRQDTNRATWPAETLGRAPYKPFLLLSVLDLMDAGRITENRIVPDEDLTDAFMLYWNAILPDRLRPSIHLPFFYLQTDGFWTLHPVPDKALPATEPSSWKNVRERYAFASLGEATFELLQNPLTAQRYFRAGLTKSSSASACFRMPSRIQPRKASVSGQPPGII